METVPLKYEEYEGEGEGTPIILVHGFFWSKFMFRKFAKCLVKETKRKVFSLDLRNHGESPSCPQVGAHLSVEDIKRFLDERELRRVVFVTHSMSSTFAYMIALEQPDRVEKLVMADHVPFLTFDEEVAERVVLSQAIRQNRLLQTLNPKITLRDAKHKYLELAKSTNFTQQIFFKKVCYDLVKRNGKFGWRHDVNLLMDQYRKKAFTPPAYGSSTHHILIIRCMDNDNKMWDDKFEEVQRHNPNAILMTMQNTTHNLMLEEPEKFSKLVADFLEDPIQRKTECS